MKPVSPVIPGAALPEVTFAKDQPQYLPLPAYRDSGDKGAVLSRWRLSWKERLKILWTGNLYLWCLTFQQPLQPLFPTVDKPDVDVESRGA